MQKKHIYLHIGAPKAASQTIQEGLFLNRSQLREAGWLVPEAGSPQGKAHHYLPWQLHWLGIEQDDPHSFKSVIAEIEQSPVHRIIISSEKFWRCTPSTIQTLREILKNYDVTVVAYLRRQDLWLHSHWLHELKIPHLPRTSLLFPFQTWIETGLQDQKILLGEREINGDFLDMLDQWAVVFGVENVRVRVLETGQLQGHVFHDFLAACDISDFEKFPTPEDVNFSPGIKVVASLQYLISHIDQTESLSSHDKSPTIRVMTRVYHLMLKYGEKKGWNTPRANYLTEALHHLIMSRFEANNLQLAQKYLGSERLFHELFVEQFTPEYDLDQLTSAEVLEMFGFVLPHLSNWMQEYNQLSHSSDEPSQAEQILMLQKQVKLLTEELLSVYQTRGWRFLNGYWQLRDTFLSLLPFSKKKKADVHPQ